MMDHNIRFPNFQSAVTYATRSATNDSYFHAHPDEIVRQILNNAQNSNTRRELIMPFLNWVPTSDREQRRKEFLIKRILTNIGTHNLSRDDLISVLMQTIDRTDIGPDRKAIALEKYVSIGFNEGEIRTFINRNRTDRNNPQPSVEEILTAVISGINTRIRNTNPNHPEAEQRTQESLSCLLNLLQGWAHQLDAQHLTVIISSASIDRTMEEVRVTCLKYVLNHNSRNDTHLQQMEDLLDSIQSLDSRRETHELFMTKLSFESSLYDTVAGRLSAIRQLLETSGFSELLSFYINTSDNTKTLISNNLDKIVQYKWNRVPPPNTDFSWRVNNPEQDFLSFCQAAATLQLHTENTQQFKLQLFTRGLETTLNQREHITHENFFLKLSPAIIRYNVRLSENSLTAIIATFEDRIRHTNDNAAIPEQEKEQTKEKIFNNLHTLLHYWTMYFNEVDLTNLITIADNRDVPNKIRVILLQYVLMHYKCKPYHNSRIESRLDLIQSLGDRIETVTLFLNKLTIGTLLYGRVHGHLPAITQLIEARTFAELFDIFSSETDDTKSFIRNNLEKIVQYKWGRHDTPNNDLRWRIDNPERDFLNFVQSLPPIADWVLDPPTLEQTFKQSLFRYGLKAVINQREHITDITYFPQLFSAIIQLDTVDIIALEDEEQIVENTRSLLDDPFPPHILTTFWQAVLEDPQLNLQHLDAIIKRHPLGRQNLETITEKLAKNYFTDLTSTRQKMDIFNKIIDSPHVSRQCIDDILGLLDDIHDYSEIVKLLEKIESKDASLRRPQDVTRLERYNQLHASFPKSESLTGLILFAEENKHQRRLFQKHCDAIVCDFFKRISGEKHATLFITSMTMPIPQSKSTQKLILKLLKSIIKNVVDKSIAEPVMLKRLQLILNYPLTDIELLKSTVNAYDNLSPRPDSIHEQRDFITKASLSPIIASDPEYKAELSNQIITELELTDVAHDNTLGRLMTYAEQATLHREFLSSNVDAIVSGILRQVPGGHRYWYIDDFINSSDPQQDEMLNIKRLILKRLVINIGIGDIEQSLSLPTLQNILDNHTPDEEILNAIAHAFLNNNFHGDAAFQLLTAINQHDNANKDTVTIAINGVARLLTESPVPEEQYQTETLTPLENFLREISQYDHFSEEHLNQLLAIATGTPLPTKRVRAILFNTILNNQQHTESHIENIFNSLDSMGAVDRKVTVLQGIVNSPYATDTHRAKLAQQETLARLINESTSFEELMSFVSDGTSTPGSNLWEVLRRAFVICENIYSRTPEARRARTLPDIIKTQFPNDHSNASLVKLSRRLLQKMAEIIKKEDMGANEIMTAVIEHPLVLEETLVSSIDKYFAWNKGRSTLAMLAKAYQLQNLTESHRKKLFENAIDILTEPVRLLEEDAYTVVYSDPSFGNTFTRRIIACLRESNDFYSMIATNLDSLFRDGLNFSELIDGLVDNINAGDPFGPTLKVNLLESILPRLPKEKLLTDSLVNIYFRPLSVEFINTETVNLCFNGYIATRAIKSNSLECFTLAIDHPNANAETVDTIAKNLSLVLQTPSDISEIPNIGARLGTLMGFITLNAHFQTGYFHEFFNAIRSDNIPEDFKFVILDTIVSDDRCTTEYADIVIDDFIKELQSVSHQVTLLEKVQRYRDVSAQLDAAHAKQSEELHATEIARVVGRFNSLPEFIEFLRGDNHSEGIDLAFAIENVEPIFAGVFEKTLTREPYTLSEIPAIYIQNQHDHSALLMELCDSLIVEGFSLVALKTKLLNCIIKFSTRENVKNPNTLMGIFRLISIDTDLTTETLNLIISEGIRKCNPPLPPRDVLPFITDFIRFPVVADGDTIASAIAYACLENRVREAETLLIDFEETHLLDFLDVIIASELTQLGQLTALYQIINRHNLPIDESRNRVLTDLRNKYRRMITPLGQNPDEQILPKFLLEVPEDILNIITTHISVADLYSLIKISDTSLPRDIIRNLNIFVSSKIKDTSNEQKDALSTLTTQQILAILANEAGVDTNNNQSSEAVDAYHTLRRLMPLQTLTFAQIQQSQRALDILINRRDQHSREVQQLLQNVNQMQVGEVFLNEDIARTLTDADRLNSGDVLEVINSPDIIHHSLQILHTVKAFPFLTLRQITTTQDILLNTQNLTQLQRETVDDLIQVLSIQLQQGNIDHDQIESARYIRQSLQSIRSFDLIRTVITNSQANKIRFFLQAYPALQASQAWINLANNAWVFKLLNSTLAHPQCDAIVLQSIITTTYRLYSNVLTEEQFNSLINNAIDHENATTHVANKVITNAFDAYLDRLSKNERYRLISLSINRDLANFTTVNIIIKEIKNRGLVQEIEPRESINFLQADQALDILTNHIAVVSNYSLPKQIAASLEIIQNMLPFVSHTPEQAIQARRSFKILIDWQKTAVANLRELFSDQYLISTFTASQEIDARKILHSIDNPELVVNALKALEKREAREFISAEHITQARNILLTSPTSDVLTHLSPLNALVQRLTELEQSDWRNAPREDIQRILQALEPITIAMDLYNSGNLYIDTVSKVISTLTSYATVQTLQAHITQQSPNLLTAGEALDLLTSYIDHMDNHTPDQETPLPPAVIANRQTLQDTLSLNNLTNEQSIQMLRSLNVLMDWQKTAVTERKRAFVTTHRDRVNNNNAVIQLRQLIDALDSSEIFSHALSTLKREDFQRLFSNEQITSAQNILLMTELPDDPQTLLQQIDPLIQTLTGLERPDIPDIQRQGLQYIRRALTIMQSIVNFNVVGLDNNNDIYDREEILRLSFALNSHVALQVLQSHIMQQVPKLWISTLLNSELQSHECAASEINEAIVTASSAFPDIITQDQLLSLLDKALSHDNVDAHTVNLAITTAMSLLPDGITPEQLTSLLDKAFSHNDAKTINAAITKASELFSDIITNDQLILFLDKALNYDNADASTVNLAITTASSLLPDSIQLISLLHKALDHDNADASTVNLVITQAFVLYPAHINENEFHSLFNRAINHNLANRSTWDAALSELKARDEIPNIRDLLNTLMNSDKAALPGGIISSSIMRDIVDGELSIPEDQLTLVVQDVITSDYAHLNTLEIFLQAVENGDLSIPRNELGTLLSTAMLQSYINTETHNKIVLGVINKTLAISDDQTVDFLMTAMGPYERTDRTTISLIINSLKDKTLAIADDRLDEFLLSAINSAHADTELTNDVARSVIQNIIPFTSPNHAIQFVLKVMKTRHADDTTAMIVIQFLRSQFKKSNIDNTALTILVDALKDDALRSHLSGSQIESLLNAAMKSDGADVHLLNNILLNVINKTFSFPEHYAERFVANIINHTKADKTTHFILLDCIEYKHLPEGVRTSFLFRKMMSAQSADSAVLKKSVQLIFSVEPGPSKSNLERLICDFALKKGDAEVLNVIAQCLYTHPEKLSPDTHAFIYDEMMKSPLSNETTFHWIGKTISEGKISFFPGEREILAKLLNDLLDRVCIENPWEIKRVSRPNPNEPSGTYEDNQLIRRDTEESNTIEAGELTPEIMTHIIKTLDRYKTLGPDWLEGPVWKVTNGATLNSDHISMLVDITPHMPPTDQLRHYITLINEDNFSKQHGLKIISSMDADNSEEKQRLFTRLLTKEPSLIIDVVQLNTMPALSAAASSIHTPGQIFDEILGKLEEKIRLQQDVSSIPDSLAAIVRHPNISHEQISRAFRISKEIPGMSQSILLDAAVRNPNIAQHVDFLFGQLGVRLTEKGTPPSSRQIAMDNSHETGVSYVNYYERMTKDSDMKEEHLQTLLQLANKNNMPESKDRLRLRLAVGLHDNASATQLNDITEKLENYLNKNNISTLDNLKQTLDEVILIKIKSMHKNIYPHRPMHSPIDISMSGKTFDAVPAGLCIVGNDQHGRAAVLYEVKKENASDSEPTNFYAFGRPQQMKDSQNQSNGFTWGGIEANAKTFKNGSIPDAATKLENMPPNVRIEVRPHSSSPLASQSVSRQHSARH